MDNPWTVIESNGKHVYIRRDDVVSVTREYKTVKLWLRHDPTTRVFDFTTDKDAIKFVECLTNP